jgi:hypothetical protein
MTMPRTILLLLLLTLLVKHESSWCQFSDAQHGYVNRVKVICVDSFLTGLPEYTISPALFNYLVTTDTILQKNVITFDILIEDFPNILLKPAQINSLFRYSFEYERGFHTVALIAIYDELYRYPSVVNISRFGKFTYNGILASGPLALIKLLKDRGCGCK